jgi:hypothetical protein
MIHSVNLQAALESVTEYWSPKVVEPVNDQYVKVAKLKGSPAWYMHDQEDELFQVIYGSLRIEFKNDAEVILNSGRILRSSESVLHNPAAEEEYGMRIRANCIAYAAQDWRLNTSWIERWPDIIGGNLLRTSTSRIPCRSAGSERRDD